MTEESAKPVAPAVRRLYLVGLSVAGVLGIILALNAALSNDFIQAGLNTLSDDHRTAVVLSDIEGLSYDEVAAVTGAKLGTVKSRIHRGRTQLRDYLREQSVFGDESVGAARGRAGASARIPWNHQG